MNCIGVSVASLWGFANSSLFSSKNQEAEFSPPRSSALFSSLTQKKSQVIMVNGNDINKMMRKGLEALNLPEDFFRDKKAVIKPNTHWSEDYPSTTDPASLLPLIDFLRQRKSGNITVADGSGKDLPSYRSAFEYINYENIVGAKGVNIVPIDIWKLNDFILVKNSQWSILSALSIHPIIYNASILISMTCLKRHGRPQLTAALKNNVGAISARSRYYLHYSTIEKFREAVAEVADAVRPDISIVDAREILVKEGPMFKPDKSNLKRGINKLLISTDPAALDTVASRLMSEHDKTFDLNQFQPTLDHASELNLGKTDMDSIDILQLGN